MHLQERGTERVLPASHWVMAFMMSTLLAHSEHVPPAVRTGLLAADLAAPSDRGPLLGSAARILYAQANLDSADALELVDLPAACGCGCGHVAEP